MVCRALAARSHVIGGPVLVIVLFARCEQRFAAMTVLVIVRVNVVYKKCRTIPIPTMVTAIKVKHNTSREVRSITRQGVGKKAQPQETFLVSFLIQLSQQLAVRKPSPPYRYRREPNVNQCFADAT